MGAGGAGGAPVSGEELSWGGTTDPEGTSAADSGGTAAEIADEVAASPDG